MESNSVCSHTRKSDNKIGQPRSGSPICLSRVCLQVELGEVLLPINYKNYNFREKKGNQVMEERENLHLRPL